MKFQRGQAKREVREAMKLTRPRPIWVTLFFFFIVNLVGGVISAVFSVLAGGGVLTSPNLLGAMFTNNYNTIVSNTGPAPAIPPGTMIYMSVIAFLGWLISTLWQSAMSVGYTDYCMSMVRHENPGIDRLFAMLRHAWPIIATSFLVGLFSALWSILFYLIWLIGMGIGAALAYALPALTFLGTLVMIAVSVVMVVGIFWAVLRYAMVSYLMVDRKVFGLAAIRESKALMKGNLLKYVGMQLSFILWYLPTIIGTGFLTLRMSTLIGETAANAVVGIFDESYVQDAIYGLLGTIALFGLVILLQAILNLYVMPYVRGTESKFYFWLSGADEGAQRPDVPPVPPVNGPYTWTDEFQNGGQSTYSDSAARPQQPPRELPPQPAEPAAPPEPPAAPDVPAEPAAPEDPWDRPDQSTAGPEEPKE